MNLEHVIENNLEDHLLISDYDADSFPKDTPLCLGIDEAGRGPVLGPMVYAALFCPADQEQKLKEMECADSKQLKEEDREKILDKLNEENKFCGYAIKVLSPNTISTNMLARVKYNLNEISHGAAIALIDTLYNGRGLNITKVFLDTVGDPTKYENKLAKIFPKLKIKVSKKADSLYPCVSAASICAKVSRDYVLKNWKHKEDVSVNEFGSGYPGDPKTKKFLTDTLDPVFGFVKLIRFGWSTAAVIIQKKCSQIKWADDDGAETFDEDFDQEDDENSTTKSKKRPAAVKPKSAKKLKDAVAKEKNNSSLLSFFSSPSQKRTIASAQNEDVISSYMKNNNLRFCTAF